MIICIQNKHAEPLRRVLMFLQTMTTDRDGKEAALIVAEQVSVEQLRAAYKLWLREQTTAVDKPAATP